jgi:hypothetical protein
MRIAGAAAVGGPAGLFLGVLGAIVELSQPLERLAAARAGRPDPWLAPPEAQDAASPRSVAEAYRRWSQFA